MARRLKGGEVIGLSGQLGSGKTTFVKGVAQGLKIKDEIQSPTFVYLKLYPTSPRLRRTDPSKPNLCHIDFYKIEKVEQLGAIGIYDYLGRSDIVCLIEWAEKFKKDLPEDFSTIGFQYLDSKDKRLIKIEGAIEKYFQG